MLTQVNCYQLQLDELFRGQVSTVMSLATRLGSRNQRRKNRCRQRAAYYKFTFQDQAHSSFMAGVAAAVPGPDAAAVVVAAVSRHQ
jgi:hypothetical protein